MMLIKFHRKSHHNGGGFLNRAKRWRNLIIIPSFQYSEHALESYCHCSSFSVYDIHLKREQQYFFSLKYAELCA